MITRGSLGIWRRSISRGILFSSERLRHLPPVEWLFLRRHLVLGKLLLPLRTILVGCVVGEPQAIVFLVSTGQHFQMQDAAWDQCDAFSSIHGPRRVRGSLGTFEAAKFLPWVELGDFAQLLRHAEWEIQSNEVIRGIEVILSGFIDDSNHSVLFPEPIGQRGAKV